eukprot:TRINITY_DN28381_c0_g1_i1.p1 TRINITY_DN28381_c0_g1~~TRINITY_DN28381_c0_g1_i1.p1  ORF type:complete len:1539 (+),score=462.44 TRINITY_DN28381_c0_g1_i1:285-4619(+)
MQALGNLLECNPSGVRTSCSLKVADHLASALRRYVGSWHVSAAGVELARTLACAEGTARELRTAGVLQAVVTVLLAHAAVGGVARAGCAALRAAFCAAPDSDARDACMSAARDGALPALESALTLHPKDLQVVRDGLHALLSVASVEHAEKDVAAAWAGWPQPALETVLGVAHQHVWHGPAAEAALELLSWVSRDARTREHLAAGPGDPDHAVLPFIDAVLRKHSAERPRVVGVALATAPPLIDTVLSRSAQTQAFVGDAGDSDEDIPAEELATRVRRASLRLRCNKAALPRLVQSACSVLSSHAADSTLQLLGIRCIVAALGREYSAEHVPVDVAEEAFRAVCAGLTAFPSHVEIQITGCDALLVMLQSPAARSGFSWRFDGCACADVLVAALDQTDEVHRTALEAVALLEQCENPLVSGDGGSFEEQSPQLWPESLKRRVLDHAARAMAGESARAVCAALDVVRQLVAKMLQTGQDAAILGVVSDALLDSAAATLNVHKHNRVRRRLALSALAALLELPPHVDRLCHGSVAADFASSVVAETDAAIRDKDREAAAEGVTVLKLLCEHGPEGRKAAAAPPNDGAGVVVRVLREFAGHRSVVGCAVAALRELVVGGVEEVVACGIRARVIEAGGADAVVETTRAQLSREDLQTDLVFVAAALTSSAAGCEAIGIRGGAAAVVASMLRHDRAQRLQEDGCLTLANIAKGNAGGAVFGGRDTVLAVVSAAASFPSDVPIVQHACKAARDFATALASSDRRPATLDAERRCINVLLDLMPIHVELSNVQVDGCAALSMFLQVPGLEPALVRADTAKVAVCAAEWWRGDEEVQAQALGLLQSYFDAARRLPRKVPVLCETERIVGAVVAALMQHSDAALNRACFRVLRSLCCCSAEEGCGGERVLRAMLCASSAAAAAVRSMSSNPDDVRIQQEAASCLHFLGDGDVRTLLVEKPVEGGGIGVRLAGAAVAEVRPGSAAEDAGFTPGMEIVGVGGRMVGSGQGVEDAFSATRYGRPFEVVVREGAAPVSDVIAADGMYLLSAAVATHSRNAPLAEAVTAALLSFVSASEDASVRLASIEVPTHRGDTRVAEVLIDLIGTHLGATGIVQQCLGILEVLLHVAEGASCVLALAEGIVDAVLRVVRHQAHADHQPTQLAAMRVVSALLNAASEDGARAVDKLREAAIDGVLRSISVLMLRYGSSRAVQQTGASALYGVGRSEVGAERMRQVTVATIGAVALPIDAALFRRHVPKSSAAKAALVSAAQAHRLDVDVIAVVFRALQEMLPTDLADPFGKSITEPLVRVAVEAVIDHAEDAEIVGCAADVINFLAASGPHRVTIGAQCGPEALVRALRIHARTPAVAIRSLAALVAVATNMDCCRWGRWGGRDARKAAAGWGRPARVAQRTTFTRCTQRRRRRTRWSVRRVRACSRYSLRPSLRGPRSCRKSTS